MENIAFLVFIFVRPHSPTYIFIPKNNKNTAYKIQSNFCETWLISHCTVYSINLFFSLFYLSIFIIETDEGIKSTPYFDRLSNSNMIGNEYVMMISSISAAREKWNENVLPLVYYVVSPTNWCLDFFHKK